MSSRAPSVLSLAVPVPPHLLPYGGIGALGPRSASARGAGQGGDSGRGAGGSTARSRWRFPWAFGRALPCGTWPCDPPACGAASRWVSPGRRVLLRREPLQKPPCSPFLCLLLAVPRSVASRAPAGLGTQLSPWLERDLLSSGCPLWLLRLCWAWNPAALGALEINKRVVIETNMLVALGASKLAPLAGPGRRSWEQQRVGGRLCLRRSRLKSVSGRNSRGLLVLLVSFV